MDASATPYGEGHETSASAVRSPKAILHNEEELVDSRPQIRFPSSETFSVAFLFGLTPSLSEPFRSYRGGGSEDADDY